MTAEDIPALIAESREAARVLYYDGKSNSSRRLSRMADALETVTAERDALRAVIQEAHNALSLGGFPLGLVLGILSRAIGTKEQS